jgi:hypothetical protein
MHLRCINLNNTQQVDNPEIFIIFDRYKSKSSEDEEKVFINGYNVTIMMARSNNG